MVADNEGAIEMASGSKNDRLRELDLFKNADDDALANLSSAIDEVTVEAGRVLIEQDKNHHEIYVIASGSAVVEVDGAEVAEIPAGELVGELGFFVQAAASATVRTKTSCDLMVIPYNRFDQILNDNPKMVRDIAAELAERLYAMDEKLN